MTAFPSNAHTGAELPLYLRGLGTPPGLEEDRIHAMLTAEVVRLQRVVAALREEKETWRLACHEERVAAAEAIGQLRKETAEVPRLEDAYTHEEIQTAYRAGLSVGWCLGECGMGEARHEAFQAGWAWGSTPGAVLEALGWDPGVTVTIVEEPA